MPAAATCRPRSAGCSGAWARTTWRCTCATTMCRAFGSQTSGSLGWGWRVAPAWKVIAQVANAFNAAPTLGYLYAPFFGNPALQPELSGSAELGLQYAAANQRVRATLFKHPGQAGTGLRPGGAPLQQHRPHPQPGAGGVVRRPHRQCRCAWQPDAAGPDRRRHRHAACAGAAARWRRWRCRSRWARACGWVPPAAPCRQPARRRGAAAGLHRGPGWTLDSAACATTWPARTTSSARTYPTGRTCRLPDWPALADAVTNGRAAVGRALAWGRVGVERTPSASWAALATCGPGHRGTSGPSGLASPSWPCLHRLGAGRRAPAVAGAAGHRQPAAHGPGAGLGTGNGTGRVEGPHHR